MAKEVYLPDTLAEAHKVIRALHADLDGMTVSHYTQAQYDAAVDLAVRRKRVVEKLHERLKRIVRCVDAVRMECEDD